MLLRQQEEEEVVVRSIMMATKDRALWESQTQVLVTMAGLVRHPLVAPEKPPWSALVAQVLLVQLSAE